jgi:hypothetical protein
MNNIEVAVTVTGAAVAADLPSVFEPAPFELAAFATGFFSIGFLAAGFFSVGFFAAGALSTTSALVVLAAGFLPGGVLAEAVFSAGFFEVGAFDRGVESIFGSTESELFFFTISGALQAVSLSGHTHRFETLKLCQTLL